VSGGLGRQAYVSCLTSHVELGEKDISALEANALTCVMALSTLQEYRRCE